MTSATFRVTGPDGATYDITAPEGATEAQSLGDDGKRRAIGEMTGNTGGVRSLQERLEMEHQGNLTFGEANGNSATANRQAIDADLNVGTVLNLLSPRALIGGAVNYVASGAMAGFRNEVKTRIGQLVTETNPQTVREMMAAIEQRAATDREFANLLHRSGITASKAYAGAIFPETGETEQLNGIGFNEDGTAYGQYGPAEAGTGL